MRGYVDTRWGQLHYSSTGSGPRTVVLLHETPLNHAAFQRLIPLLSDTFRVVAFDSPGYGESDGPVAPTSIEEYAETVGAAIETLGLDQIVLYGAHTGGSLALHLGAVTVAERVHGIALSGLPFYTDEVRGAKVVRAVPPVADDGSHLLDTFLWEPDTYDAEMRSRLVAGVARDQQTAYRAFHAVYTYEPAKVIDRIGCPVTLLSHPGDPLFDADNRFSAAVPGARQVVVDTERLPVYWTKPEVVASEIAALAASADG
ncbi:alpha/beta fold hydrolase [Nocardia miyunensis]|uniref:alpha/beta fold hydrolase n=1 Tax=Nocardia miyunensis TaxID=282684 RepID=UPI00083216A2|nr:alpha/beta hydrolase [Nocardia miyunensis]